MPSYSSDISSVALSLGGVIDGSFIANVKKSILLSFCFGTSMFWSCITHPVALKIMEL